MGAAKVLVAGEWRDSDSIASFQGFDPATASVIDQTYPVSSRAEVFAALGAAAEAVDSLWDADTSTFLEAYAAGIEAHAGALVELANRETGLPVAPRLREVELPRTTDQLRQAAAAAKSGSWRKPVRDEAKALYSVRAPIGGPIVVMGPNNFPFAYNSVAGGDFAAAIAARCPVIAKANPGHPGTTALLAEIAHRAVLDAGLHPSAVQMVFDMPREVGLELVAHPMVGATAFTGSRQGGLALKAAADAAGKPIYLELSSINPVVLMPGALRERLDAVADELFTSCTMGAGQFCTSPGIVFLLSNTEFVAASKSRFASGSRGQLLGEGVLKGLTEAVSKLRDAGAELLAGGTASGVGFAPTLLRISGEQFLRHPGVFQQEAFGPCTLLVEASDLGQLHHMLQQLEGNLTGAIYSATDGSDEDAYRRLEPALRRRVGRLLNDKMPTGVAVSPAMNHGGPYPSTGHPGFTAVGFPASIERFTALHCYDAVRPERLPAELRSLA